MYKTFEEVAIAVDEMFSTALQNAGRKHIDYYHRAPCLSISSVTGGNDSGDEDDEDDGARRDNEEEEDGDGALESPVSRIALDSLLDKATDTPP